MSDGSGLDFGTIRSRALSEQGRKEHDRIFKVKETVCEKMKRQQVSDSDFDPQQHEQMR